MINIILLWPDHYFDQCLRGRHLRNLHFAPYDYTPHHTEAMRDLINIYGYSLEQALSYCDKGMDDVQAVYSWN